VRSEKFKKKQKKRIRKIGKMDDGSE